MEIIGCGIHELPNGLQFCASPQYLEIRSCLNLKSIPESLHSCVSLQKFVVRYCPQLSSLPGVPSIIQQFSKSLQYLEIQYCRNLKSIPDLGEVFHSLINLKISNCPDPRLKLLREGRLKTLVIGGFIEELDAFPILRYPSIRYSHASLKNLMYLPILHLSNLKKKKKFRLMHIELIYRNLSHQPLWLLEFCKKSETLHFTMHVLLEIIRACFLSIHDNIHTHSFSQRLNFSS